MRKNLLAMICSEGGSVTDRKYVSSTSEALEWAKDQTQLGCYEIVVFRSSEEKPILHYGFQSIWHCVEG